MKYIFLTLLLDMSSQFDSMKMLFNPLGAIWTMSLNQVEHGTYSAWMFSCCSVVFLSLVSIAAEKKLI